jgi:hypothetical protein
MVKALALVRTDPLELARKAIVFGCAAALILAERALPIL